MENPPNSAKLFIIETMAYYNLVIRKLSRVLKITDRKFKIEIAIM